MPFLCCFICIYNEEIPNLKDWKKSRFDQNTWPIEKYNLSIWIYMQHGISIVVWIVLGRMLRTKTLMITLVVIVYTVWLNIHIVDYILMYNTKYKNINCWHYNSFSLEQLPCDEELLGFMNIFVFCSYTPRCVVRIAFELRTKANWIIQNSDLFDRELPRFTYHMKT